MFSHNSRPSYSITFVLCLNLIHSNDKAYHYTYNRCIVYYFLKELDVFERLVQNKQLPERFFYSVYNNEWFGLRWSKEPGQKPSRWEGKWTQTNKQSDGQTNVDPSLMSKACGQTFEPPAHPCREFGCVEREKLLIIRVFCAKPSRSLDTVNDENENIINTSIIYLY